MKKTIILVLEIMAAGGNLGFGDQIFIKKLAEQLIAAYQKRYPGLSAPIYIVTDYIERPDLIPNSLPYMNIGDMERAIKDKRINPSLIITAPVPYRTCRVNAVTERIAKASGKQLPLLMVSEYDFPFRGYEEAAKSSLDQGLIQEPQYIYSGFNTKEEPRFKVGQGILHSPELLPSVCDDTMIESLWAQIPQSDARVRDLICSNPTTYKQTHNLSLQYSHDDQYCQKMQGQNAGSYFLSLHPYSCHPTDDRHQDVLIVGNDAKMQNIMHQINQSSFHATLKRQGFTHLYIENTFNNTSTKIELGSTKATEKIYRVILTNEVLSHQSMIAYTALSGPFMGNTGDQSLGEALSAGKMFIYETYLHKKQLLQSYSALFQRKLEELYGDNESLLKKIALAQRLLQGTATQEDFYEIDILSNKDVQEGFSRIHQAIIEEYHLVEEIAEIMFNALDLEADYAADDSTEVEYPQTIKPVTKPVIKPEVEYPQTIKPVIKPVLNSLSMYILSGFITVLGITAVVLAFTIFNTTTLGFGLAVGLGAAALLGGIGLFGVTKYSDVTETPSLEPTFA